MAYYRYDLFEDWGRTGIVRDAKVIAEQLVRDFYPYGVKRQRSEIATLAEKSFPFLIAYANKEDRKYEPYKNISELTNDVETFKQVYIPTFIATYLEELSKRDAKHKIDNFNGTLKIDEAEHMKGINSYTVTLSDYRYLKRSHKFRILLNDKDEVIQIEEVP
jgi:hypothetical protein